jgi:hypothetical protein
LIGLTAAGLLAFFHWCAPLEFTSVLTWAGVAVAVAGAISLLCPLRFFAIRGRRAGAATLLGGALLAAAGLEWPAHRTAVTERRTALDAAMPEYDFVERHEVLIQTPPERAMQAAREVTFGDLRVYNALMGLRAAAAGKRYAADEGISAQPILQTMARPGSEFVALEGRTGEAVFGMAGRPWSSRPGPRPQSAAEFADFRAPASVRIAFNLAVEDAGSGLSRLVTETRVLATDDAGREVMKRYWRLIYPGSGMIRRMWLRAARERAERGF